MNIENTTPQASAATLTEKEVSALPNTPDTSIYLNDDTYHAMLSKLVQIAEEHTHNPDACTQSLMVAALGEVGGVWPDECRRDREKEEARIASDRSRPTPSAPSAMQMATALAGVSTKTVHNMIKQCHGDMVKPAEKAALRAAGNHLNVETLPWEAA